MNTRLILIASLPALSFGQTLPYTVVDTGQSHCYDNRGEMNPPSPGRPFHGQDAQFQGPAACYTISADGLTAHDENTGLTWQRAPETNGDGKLTHDDKLTWEEALRQPAKLNAAKFGGFDDWRLPSIKELYSLFDARGTDPGLGDTADNSNLRPFMDSKTFPFIYGDVEHGSRIIDSQYGSATKYVGKSPRGGDKVFGVNFADGRIKGYDQGMPGGNRRFRFFILCVRGNPQYGKNDFKDNGDGTVSDRATGLTWTRDDSGRPMDWEQALAWVQRMNTAKFLGRDDWRLPNVKELQSLVDYSRSPDTSNSPAIDPVFRCSTITDEAGKPDYPFYWSGTTHIGHLGGSAAMYVCFGRAGGFLPEQMLQGSRPPAGPETRSDGPVRLVDVHGAGAQRSDPKAGDPKQFPRGRGPQGDVVRILNHVRLVRGGDVKPHIADAVPAMVHREGPPRQGPPDGNPGQNAGFNPPLIQALDTNRDDVIDAKEIAAAAEALLKLDSNKDGSLSPSEYRPRMRPEGGGAPDGPPEGRFPQQPGH